MRRIDSLFIFFMVAFAVALWSYFGWQETKAQELTGPIGPPLPPILAMADTTPPLAPFVMLPAQVAPTIVTQKVVSWGKPGGKTTWTDVKGNPETLAKVEIVVANLGIDLNAAGTQPKVESEVYNYSGTDSQNVAAVLGRLPATGPYTIWMRVQDASNNVSAWTKGNDFIYDGSAPQSAVNVTIQ